MTAPTEDLLVVRLSAMGDVVHALGAIEALAHAVPSARVHVAVQRSFAPLFDGLTHVAAVIAHQRRPAVAGMWASLRRLRAQRFAAALDLQGNWKSALVTRLAPAQRRIGIAAPARREPRSAALLGEVVTPTALHPALWALDVVRAYAPDAKPRPSRLVATPAELDAEREVLAALGIRADRPFLLLVLGDPRDNRTWPLSMATRAAVASPWPTVALAGPAEPAELQPPPGVPLLRHAPGQLRRLVALGVLLARNGGQAIGPDQGPTHVLAACGAEVIAMFGPQDPQRTAPLLAQVRVSPTPPPCMPCRARTCSHPDGPVCMRFAVEHGVAVQVRRPVDPRGA